MVLDGTTRLNYYASWCHPRYWLKQFFMRTHIQLTLKISAYSLTWTRTLLEIYNYFLRSVVVTSYQWRALDQWLLTPINRQWVYRHQSVAVRSHQWLLPPIAWSVAARSHQWLLTPIAWPVGSNKPPVTMDTDHCSSSVITPKWPRESLLKATMDNIATPPIAVYEITW